MAIYGFTKFKYIKIREQIKLCIPQKLPHQLLEILCPKAQASTIVDKQKHCIKFSRNKWAIFPFDYDNKYRVIPYLKIVVTSLR